MEELQSDARKLFKDAMKMKNRNDNFLMRLFGGVNIEEIAEMLTVSGNKFRAAKNHKEAILSYIEAGECHIKCGSYGYYAAATQFVNAAEIYRLFDDCTTDSNKEAINLLRRAIKIYIDVGYFHSAVKHQMEIAEIHEKVGNIKDAISSYLIAVDWYDGEDYKYDSAKCKMKIAHLYAQQKEWYAAYEIFEDIAVRAMESCIMKWSAKECFFKANLCCLANNDIIGTGQALERFINLDATYESTMESKLILSLIYAITSNNVTDFTNHVIQYDAIKKIDAWTTAVLLCIKQNMNEESLS